MPKLDNEIKSQIKNLSKEDLERIVLKLASREKEILDYLRATYLDKEIGQQDIFDETKDELEFLMAKSYVGRAAELRAAKMLAACGERITKFANASGNKKLEADLLVFALDNVFHRDYARQGTCFTAYDNKLRLLVSRLLTIVTKKLHPDLLMDYREKLNHYLKRLHNGSNHLDAVYSMPMKFDPKEIAYDFYDKQKDYGRFGGNVSFIMQCFEKFAS